MSKEMIDSNISTSLYGEHMDFELLNDSMDDGTSQAYVRGEILMTRRVSPCELPQMVDKYDFVIKIKSDDVIYVGDSETDVQTARNAKIDCIGCCWGFRSREVLEKEGAKYIVESPDEILRIVGV